MPINQDWVLTRSNITQLRNAADRASNNDKIPLPLRRYFIELESVLRRIEITLQDYDMDA